MTEDQRSVEEISADIAKIDAQIASAESAVGGSTERKPEPGLFDHASDSKLTSQLAKIYDSSTAKEDSRSKSNRCRMCQLRT